MGQTGELLSHNVFAYCGNNPVVRVDESGRFFMLVAGLVGAAVGAVVGAAVAAATGGDVLKGALIGGLTGGVMGLTCGAAASLVATGGATAFASTGVVMGTNTMLTATGSTVMVASEVAAVNAMAASTTTLPAIYNTITATAQNLANTNIPATFSINIEGVSLWVNSNATEHMGEYVARLDNCLSVGVRSQVMLESFSEALQLAVQEGCTFGVYGGWEFGINTVTDVIYQARWLGY